MKNIGSILCMVALALPLGAQTVDEVLDKMEANENASSSRMEITQHVYKANGDKITSKLISYGIDNGDKGMMEYRAPARIKGMKMLMLNDGDDIWFYSARTARVRKIASHQKNQSVNNSDFSYEDMSASDWRKDYTITLKAPEQRVGKDCFTLEMVPQKTAGTYAKIIFWVDKATYVGIGAEYYDEDNELWKVLTLKEVRKIGAYWTPYFIEMKNIQKGTRTEMVMDKIAYDIALDPKMFSERYLKR